MDIVREMGLNEVQIWVFLGGFFWFECVFLRFEGVFGVGGNGFESPCFLSTVNCHSAD